MGVFNQKSKFKPTAPPTIRKEVVVLDSPRPKPRPKPPGSDGASRLAVPAGGARPRPQSPAVRRRSASPYAPSPDERRVDRKRKLAGAAHRPSPASDRVEFDNDSESDDGWEAALDGRKRRKAMGQAHGRHDPNRKLAHPAVSDAAADAKPLRIIHAADVASLASKCVPVLGASADQVAVELQYPGSRQRERYVWRVRVAKHPIPPPPQRGLDTQMRGERRTEERRIRRDANARGPSQVPVSVGEGQDRRGEGH